MPYVEVWVEPEPSEADRQAVSALIAEAKILLARLDPDVDTEKFRGALTKVADLFLADVEFVSSLTAADRKYLEWAKARQKQAA